MRNLFTMRKLFAIFCLLFVFACKDKDKGDGGSVTPPAPEVTKISIQVNGSTAPLDLIVDDTADFTAIATYDDGTQKDVTDEVSWNSSSRAVASIQNGGMLTALAEGSTNITATLDGMTSNTIQVFVTEKVTLANLSISFVSPPANGEIEIGDTLQLKATASYSDGTTKDVTDEVTWRYTAHSVIQITNSAVLGLSEGVSTIAATLDGMTSNSLSVTVKAEVKLAKLIISFDPAPAMSNGKYEINIGDIATLKAEAEYSDGTTKVVTNEVIWQNSTSSVLELTNNIVSGLSEGESEITATLDGVTSNVLLVEVKTDLKLVDIKISFVPEPVATSTGGYVLMLGDKLALNAMGTYSDGQQKDITTEVLWQNTNPSVLAITGINTEAMAEGSTDITASLDGITSGNLSAIVVTTPVVVRLELEFVTPPAINSNKYQLVLNMPYALSATAFYSDNSTSNVTSSGLLSWKDDPSRGQFRGSVYSPNTTGTTDISATYDDPVIGDVVSNALSVNISSNLTLNRIDIEMDSEIVPNDENVYELKVGETFDLKSVAVYSDESKEDVVNNDIYWVSENRTVADVDPFSGVLTTFKEGTATIKLSKFPFTYALFKIVVTNETKLNNLKIDVDPELPLQAQDDYYLLNFGQSVDTKVRAIYNDGSEEDVTNQVAWGKGEMVGDMFNANDHYASLANNVLSGLIPMEYSAEEEALGADKPEFVYIDATLRDPSIVGQLSVWVTDIEELELDISTVRNANGDIVYDRAAGIGELIAFGDHYVIDPNSEVTFSLVTERIGQDNEKSQYDEALKAFWDYSNTDIISYNREIPVNKVTVTDTGELYVSAMIDGVRSKAIRISVLNTGRTN